MHVTKQLKAYDRKEEGKDQRSIQSTSADPESFVRGGSLATFFFIILREDQNTTKSSIFILDIIRPFHKNDGLQCTLHLEF